MYTSPNIIQRNVNINGESVPVRFKRNITLNHFKCSSARGVIRVHCEGEKFFHATMDGKTTKVIGRNGKDAFAKAVSKFWSK